MRVSAASVSSNPPPVTTEPATEPRKPTIYRRPEPIRAAVIGTGTSFAELSADGKLAHITGFFADA